MWHYGKNKRLGFQSARHPQNKKLLKKHRCNTMRSWTKGRQEGRKGRGNSRTHFTRQILSWRLVVMGGEEGTGGVRDDSDVSNLRLPSVAGTRENGEIGWGNTWQEMNDGELWASQNKTCINFEPIKIEKEITYYGASAITVKSRASWAARCTPQRNAVLTHLPSLPWKHATGKSETRAGPEKAWLLWLSQPSSKMPHQLFQHKTTEQLPPNNSGTAGRAPRRNPMRHQLTNNFNLPSPIFFF